MDAEGGAETFAWSAVGGGVVAAAAGVDAPLLGAGEDSPADDSAGAEVPSVPVAAGVEVPSEPVAAGASLPVGGAEPWGAGGVKSAVSPKAGSGCLAVLAFSKKAAKVLSPSSGALIAKTMPLLQWLS